MDQTKGKERRTFTPIDFIQAKKVQKKIVMLTAYDYPTAKLLNNAGIDAILVGDSLGMVVLGYEDTIKVTMEDMIHHIKAVLRGSGSMMVIGDMPFLSYHTGIYESVRNAGRLVSEGGCKAVKLEGGEEISSEIKAIIKAGIPVMGHLGYTPQSVNITGRPLAKGKSFDTAFRLVADALALQDAGVFSIVLECVPFRVAEFISRKLHIPTIGIGSGQACDGQILITSEITGLYKDFIPKHSKRYLDAGTLIEGAVNTYKNEVMNGEFPTEQNSFIVNNEVIERLAAAYPETT